MNGDVVKHLQIHECSLDSIVRNKSKSLGDDYCFDYLKKATFLQEPFWEKFPQKLVPKSINMNKWNV